MTALDCSLNDLKAFCRTSSIVSPSLQPEARFGLVKDKLFPFTVPAGKVALVIVLAGTLDSTPPPFKYLTVT